MNEVLKYFNLKGYKAFVTGAGGYIGQEISMSLAEAGAFVFLNGRKMFKLKSIQKKIKNKGLKSEICCFDINNEKKVKKFFNTQNQINIIVNNAHSGEITNFKIFKKKNFDNAFDLSVNSVARIVNYARKSLINGAKNKGSSSVINISSIYGVVSPDPNIYGNSNLNSPIYYGCSKAAMIQYTKYAAVHLAKDNIRVNAVIPGAFPEKKIVKKFPKFYTNLLKKIPIRRVGRPDDIKSTIIFLSSNSSSYITGSNIFVDGGWTAW